MDPRGAAAGSHRMSGTSAAWRVRRDVGEQSAKRTNVTASAFSHVRGRRPGPTGVASPFGTNEPRGAEHVVRELNAFPTRPEVCFRNVKHLVFRRSVFGAVHVPQRSRCPPPRDDAFVSHRVLCPPDTKCAGCPSSAAEKWQFPVLSFSLNEQKPCFYTLVYIPTHYHGHIKLQ